MAQAAEHLAAFPTKCPVSRVTPPVSRARMALAALRVTGYEIRVRDQGGAPMSERHRGGNLGLWPATCSTTATLRPCAKPLPGGWSVEGFEVRSGLARSGSTATGPAPVRRRPR